MLARQGTQVELTDLLRSKKELELQVEDLRIAVSRASGTRTDLEAELAVIDGQIHEKEKVLAELMPRWEQHRMREASLRKSLDEARARLSALFAKRGRHARFHTRDERDAFLRRETSALERHRATRILLLRPCTWNLNELG